jgi:glutathione S-transferase
MQVHYARRLAAQSLHGHAKLAQWYDRLLLRPSFRTVVEEIRQADAELSAPVPGAFR